MRVGCELSVAHYTEGQCDGCVPQYGNLDKPVFKVVMKHVFFFLFVLFFFCFCFVFFSFFCYLLLFFSGLHTSYS